MANRKIKVGSRESVLAVKQAEIVMSEIRKSNPMLELELVTIKTKGDKILDRSLDKIGGKGLFIKELEQALIDMEIDIAVHSYKDVPYEETKELPIVALSKRESPFDVLILPKGVSELDKSKPIGSSSLRRSIQFKALHKGIESKLIRGNVITRLEKLDRGEYSAIILAQAGINRLSLQDRISRVFTEEEMIPSASQGILAVQGRKGENYSYLDDFHSKESECVSRAERQFLKVLNGGCSSPVAAYGQIKGNELSLTGMYVSGEADFAAQENMVRGSVCGAVDNPELLGEKLARMCFL